VHESAQGLFDRLIAQLTAGKPVLMGYMEDGITAPVRGGRHWHFIVALGYDPASEQVLARNSYGGRKLTAYPYAFLRLKLFQLVYCRGKTFTAHATPDTASYPHLLGDTTLETEKVLALLAGQDPSPAALVEIGLSREEAIALLDLASARGRDRLSRADIDAFTADLRESVRTGTCSKLTWHPPRRR
jgi:hypothetical protein